MKDISNINEFYSLGFKKIQKISASNNIGINSIFTKHLIPWISLEFKKKIKKNQIFKIL